MHALDDNYGNFPKPYILGDEVLSDTINRVMKLTKTVPSWTDGFYEMLAFSWELFLYQYNQSRGFMAFLRSKNLQTVLLISLGAVLGANFRYWLGVWAGQRLGTQFPYATLIINLTGSLILGFFITVITERYLIDPRWRVFFAFGFLGSYTTFSTYTFESIVLLMTGNWPAGLFNLLGSAFLGALAVILGIFLGRLI